MEMKKKGKKIRYGANIASSQLHELADLAAYYKMSKASIFRIAIDNLYSNTFSDVRPIKIENIIDTRII